MHFSEAGDFIIDKLKKELPGHLHYHNAGHALDVYNACERIALSENVKGEDLLLLLTAALFHDSGFLVRPEGHELISCKIAGEVLPDFGYSPQQIDTVCHIIMATKMPQSPQNHIEQIISDADLDYLGGNNFSTISGNLYLELLFLGGVKNEDDWNQQQVKFLESHHYFTETARNTRDQKKQENLEMIKAELKEKR